MGFERNVIGNSSEPYMWKDIGDEESEDTELKVLPVVNDWDQKCKAYIDRKPWTTKDHAVIVSGSTPTACLASQGAHFLVR
jgi:hypothetical protein